MLRIINKLLRLWKSYLLTKKIDSGGGRILLQSHFLKVIIRKEIGARFVLSGILRIKSFHEGREPVVIIIGRNATLTIENDFIVGNGIKIFLAENSILIIGGRDKETDSGITCLSQIMVNKKILIGKDLVCAWDVFISDSDWHKIVGTYHQSDVIVGDHVWIAHKCSILKGTVIGNNCVVASHSKTGNHVFPPHSLIAGVPGKIVKQNIDWERDIT